MSRNKYPLFGIDSYGANRAMGTPKLDPFKNPRNNPLDAVVPAEPEIAQRIREMYNDPVPVIQPRHLVAPEGARTLDITNIVTVAPGATLNLYNILAAPGSTVVILGYALWTTAAIPSDIAWTPTIDGSRVLARHGSPPFVPTPGSTFSVIRIPVGNPSMMQVIVPCQILMEPGQNFLWTVTNRTGAPVQMGARTVGYADKGQRLTSTKFGD